MRPRITYRAGSSLLHRLHPLVKGGWLIWGTLFVFIVPGPLPVLSLLGLLSVLGGHARLPLGKLRGARLFILTALALATLQILFSRDGPVLLQVGSLTITQPGVEAGVYVAGRFIAVILMSFLFVLTTDPNALAYALMQTGLPYRYGFALITALRLVPLFEQEGQTVYQAQLARGVRYDTRSPRRFVTLGRQFFMPMLVSALSKVDSLAVSMEGRCFGKHPARTYLRQVRFTLLDRSALIALLISTALLILRILLL